MEEERFVSLDKSELVPQALDLQGWVMQIQRRSVYLLDKLTSEGVTRGGSASSSLAYVR